MENLYIGKLGFLKRLFCMPDSMSMEVFLVTFMKTHVKVHRPKQNFSKTKHEFSKIKVSADTCCTSCQQSVKKTSLS